MSAASRRAARARRALKRANRYLTPLVDAAGEIAGWRFAPGPGLRAAGARSQILRAADGALLGLEAARAFRDAALARAKAGQAPPASPHVARPLSLNQLWAAYRADTQAEIDANQALAPERRDQDVIRPGTLKFYASTIKPWLAFAGDEPAGALDADTVAAQYKTQKATRSHHSAAASLAALRAVYAYGVRAGRVAANPAAGHGFAAPPGRLRLGSPEETCALVESADALAQPRMGDAIVAALWTAQRQADLLDCDLGRQLEVDGDDAFLVFARTHRADFSQQKTGGRAQVLVLQPLKNRLDGRRVGRLAPGPNGARWAADKFRRCYREVREHAAKRVASVADLQFRDLRDTAITRLHLAGIDLARIALWSGHSMKTIQQILDAHYLVATREAARDAGASFEAWRLRSGVVW